MKIRLIQAEDYERAKEICESKGFPFPSADEVIGALVAVDPDVVGVGIIRRIYEAIIAVDETAEKTRRAKAFSDLIKEGRFYSEFKAVDQWHVFVQDENVAKTLKSTFGFKECRGTPLILDFGGDHGQRRTETS